MNDMAQYGEDRFESPPDPDLVCCICQCVLQDPLESPCRHVFCRTCIKAWLTNHKDCPNCRKGLRASELKPVLPIVRNMIDRLLIKCDNRSRGCRERITLEFYEKHVKECGFVSLQCVNAGCEVTVLRREMIHHERQCKYRLVICERGCGMAIAAELERSHDCLVALKNKIKSLELGACRGRGGGGRGSPSDRGRRGDAGRDKETNVDALQGAVGGISPLEGNLRVSSMIEFDWGGSLHHGTIQWIGFIKDLQEHGKIAGIEEEDFGVYGTDGSFGTERHFEAPGKSALFLPLSRCRSDARFPSGTDTLTGRPKVTKEGFGGKECEPIDEPTISPPKGVNPDFVGMFKGIQGKLNSGYMDVTLYSMFAYNTVFDAILDYHHTTKGCIREIKDAMRATIVNPLRRNGFVRADYLFTFRKLLSNLSSMKGFQTEEKDPEEFIHALLQESLNAPPFLKISHGKNAVMDSYVYQIFLDQPSEMHLPSVAELLHLSFLQSDLKLAQMPECLIIQLPRYGKKYKLFDYIKPTLEMDIKLLIRDVPRTCSACGHLALIECKDCKPTDKDADGDLIQSFCADCFKLTHGQQDKKGHERVPLLVPNEFIAKYLKIKNDHLAEDVANETSHLYDEYQYPMELFSVVCIETSHYVAFVKTMSGNREEWVFFDSMADRTGAEDGYNIPEVVHLQDFKDQMESPNLTKCDLQNPHFRHLKRLLSDAYICFYRPVQRGNLDRSRDTGRENVHGSEDQTDSSKRQKRENQGDSQQGSKHATQPAAYWYAGSMAPDEGSTGSVHTGTSHSAPDRGHEQGHHQGMHHSDVSGATRDSVRQQDYQHPVPNSRHHGGPPRDHSHQDGYYEDSREQRQEISQRDVIRATMDPIRHRHYQHPVPKSGVPQRDHRHSGYHEDPEKQRQGMSHTDDSVANTDPARQRTYQQPVRHGEHHDAPQTAHDRSGVNGDPWQPRPGTSHSTGGDSAAVTEAAMHRDDADTSFVIVNAEQVLPTFTEKDTRL